MIEVTIEYHAIPVCDVLHIYVSDAGVNETFEKIADIVADARKFCRKVLIISDDGTGMAATQCMAYALKYSEFSVKKASKLLSKKRSNARLYRTILVKLDTWIKLYNSTKLDMIFGILPW